MGKNGDNVQLLMRNKKAIVLLATLGIVMAIVVLVNHSLGMLQSGLHDAKKFHTYNQSAILLSDLKTIIPKVFKEIKNASDFEKITYIPMVFEDVDVAITVELTIKPNTAININDINTSVQTKEFFSKILKKYGVKDEGLFMQLLENRSEIIIPRFKKQRFDSLEHWMQFVEYYASMAQDENVLKMNWEEIVQFDGIAKMDKNAVAGNIAFDDIEPPQELLYEYSLSNAQYEFVCEVNYTFESATERFRFVTNKDGKIKNFQKLEF